MRERAEIERPTAGRHGVAGGRRPTPRAAWILVAAVAWLGGASAQSPVVADLATPGVKRLKYTMSVEPSHLLAGRKLAVHAAIPSHRWSLVAPGEPFSSSVKYGTRIHLAAPGADPSEDLDSRETCAEPCVDVGYLRAMGDNLPALSTLEHVHTTLRVTRCTADELRFEVVAHDRRHDPWMVGGYAATFALGVFFARRAWARRAHGRRP